MNMITKYLNICNPIYSGVFLLCLFTLVISCTTEKKYFPQYNWKKVVYTERINDSVDKQHNYIHPDSVDTTIANSLFFKKAEFDRVVNDSVRLNMVIRYPNDLEHNKKYPTIIFFHGGGWQKGGPSQFYRTAEWFRGNGFITVLPEYRIEWTHNATPFDAVMDAKTVLRFLKETGPLLQIDPEKLVASGASSGGHLAASTAFISKYNHENDNPNIDPSPAAIVIFNPVIDNGPNGYAYDRIGKAYKDFSPIHNIKSPAPATIYFTGDRDHHTPVETANTFVDLIKENNGIGELHIYKGEGHGFHNIKLNPEIWEDINYKTLKFLKKIGIVDTSK